MVGLGSIISLAVGGLFGCLQKWLDLKADKQKAEERAKDRAHEIEVMNLEATHAEKKLRVEQEIEQQRAAGAAFTASQKYGNAPVLPENVKLTKNQTWWLVIIEAFSRAIRPFSTIYYQIAMAGVFVWCAVTLAKAGTSAMGPETAAELIREMVFSIIYLAEMTLGWWFGVSAVRPKRK